MNETLKLLSSGMGGVVLGTIFFGGLWWTVRKGVASRQPAIWFLGSVLLRMSITMGWFYFVGHEHWKRLIACLVGFVVARIAITYLTRPRVEPRLAAMEANDAP